MICGAVNFCWFVFKWSFVAILIAIVVASPFYYRRVFFRVEEELRTRIEAGIAERFPRLQIRVRAAHLTGDGIEIRGLSIAEPDAAGPQPQIAYFDEIIVECQTSLKELASGVPTVTGIKVIRPVLRATRRPDGSFSLARLLPLPEPDCPHAPVTVESGLIEVFDPLKNPSSTLTLRDVNLSIKKQAGQAEGSDTLEFQGYLVADQIRRMEFSGTLEPTTRQWAASGTVDGLEISPEFLTSLPQQVSAPLGPLACVRAPANFSFRVQGDDTGTTPRFDINGSVARGRVDNPMLPYPLVDLQATIHCDNARLRVTNLTAHHGSTVWQVAEFERRGFTADSPCTLRASGRQVRFDRGWGAALSEPWRTDWKNYDPDGDVNLDCTLVFDGRAWTPSVHVRLLDNVSFGCHRFPYRLEGGRGTLKLEGNLLDIDITAFSGAQPVYMKGRFENPGPDFSGALEIWGEKIQFDEKLFAALLKPKARETLRSLNPRGTFNFHSRVWRQPNDPLPRPEVHERARVVINRCSINYEKFPYPIGNVQGSLDMQDGVWTFPRLVGTHGTGTVIGSGRLVTSPREDLLELELHGDAVPLDKELRDALPADRQEAWNSLEPYGSINFDAKVTHRTGDKDAAIDLDVQPRGDNTSLRTSIQPVAFPYRMEFVGGSMHYRDGHVDLRDLHAVHRNTDLRCGGQCDFLPGQGWNLQLRNLSVRHLRLQGEDPELMAALPKPLRRAVTELRPSGPVNLKGSLDFAKRAEHEPLRAGWNVDMFLNRASLQVGLKLENIFGCVTLHGSSDGTRFSSHGQLKLDNLTYKNLQFTQVMGPFWFDNENAYFGSWPQAPADNVPAGRVTGQLFGGLAAADCHVTLGTVPQYHLLAGIAGADLGQFARENLTNHPRLNGKVMADVDLRGSRGAHNLSGSGNVHVSDADVYELPVMVALLKIMRAKLPDPTAFTQSDIAFELAGEHVALRRIELRGDAVNLTGEGELTLDAQTNPIKLEFHTMVGRGNMPIISGVFSRASQQIMKIHVSGTLEHPDMFTEAFPVANEALDRLRGDYDRGSPVEQASSTASAPPTRK